MKNKYAQIATVIFLAASLGVSHAVSTKLTKEAALKLATDVYIYGYPLVTMDYTKDVMTNVAKPETTKAPMGQFANLSSYPDANFKDVTTPNADTLYSVAWLDLSKEPYVLHVPNEGSRYYLMPILSAWTDVFADPGTRTTGNNQGDFVIVGPNWKGKLPTGLPIYHSTTNLVWILGRTYSTGTPEDYQQVHDIQKQYSLTPLSSFGKPYTAPAGKVDPDINVKMAVREQVNHLDAANYFRLLALLMKENPPTQADAPIVAEMAKLGIKPGEEFDLSKIDPIVADALKKSVVVGQKKIMDYRNSIQTTDTGWTITKETGQYGTNYLQRALVAIIGLGANLPQDALYPETHVDKDGKPLNGANKYIIHLNANQLPPVKGFWSLTMYDQNFFFNPNPLNRYNISQRDHLQKNSDGSIDIYIQNESPGKNKETNWLPSPKGDFNLVFRFYWPDQAILDGTWKLPPVVMVKTT